jgi:hypothetical protein
LRVARESRHPCRYATMAMEGKVVLALWEQRHGRFKTCCPGLHHLAFEARSVEEVNRTKGILDKPRHAVERRELDVPRKQRSQPGFTLTILTVCESKSRCVTTRKSPRKKARTLVPKLQDLEDLEISPTLLSLQSTPDHAEAGNFL